MADRNYAAELMTASNAGPPAREPTYAERIANFFRPWTDEERARVAEMMPPDLAPTQIVKGMVGGAADLAMQANQAMPWGGNYPQAIGIDPQAGTIDPSVIVPFAQNVAGMVGTGGMASPKPAGALGIFGGRMAKTADQAALAKAEQMAAQGADRGAIWNETGWFQGADGKWRFEIPDKSSQLNPNRYGYGIPEEPTSGVSSGHIWHPELYDAYPSAGVVDMEIGKGGGSGAYYHGDPPFIQINARDAWDGRSIGLHEMQHHVQKEEGFARGGNPKAGDVVKMGHQLKADAEKTSIALQDELMAYQDARAAEIGVTRDSPDFHSRMGELAREWRQAFPEKAKALDRARREADTPGGGRVAYHRLAGEVEARNVQKRMDMTPEQRKAQPPWATQDVPDADQIVRMLTAPSYSTGGRF